jgi:hypothetical protein
LRCPDSRLIKKFIILIPDILFLTKKRFIQGSK